VKANFQVLKLKFHACIFKQAFYTLHKLSAPDLRGGVAYSLGLVGAPFSDDAYLTTIRLFAIN